MTSSETLLSKLEGVKLSEPGASSDTAGTTEERPAVATSNNGNILASIRGVEDIRAL
jgi:hypothetical protein